MKWHEPLYARVDSDGDVPVLVDEYGGLLLIELRVYQKGARRGSMHHLLSYDDAKALRQALDEYIKGCEKDAER